VFPTIWANLFFRQLLKITEVSRIFGHKNIKKRDLLEKKLKIIEKIFKTLNKILKY
jgi:hypothetical protein